MNTIQNIDYKNFCNMIIQNNNILRDETGQFLLWMGIYLGNVEVVKYSLNNYNVNPGIEISNKIYTTFVLLGIDLFSNNSKSPKNVQNVQNVP